jgi:hypothetical protein
MLSHANLIYILKLFYFSIEKSIIDFSILTPTHHHIYIKHGSLQLHSHTLKYKCLPSCENAKSRDHHSLMIFI